MTQVKRTTEVAQWRTLSKKAARKGARAYGKYTKYLSEELMRWHKQRGIAELPVKATWQKLGVKYRAKTPAIWQQCANALAEELATIKAQRRRGSA